MPTADPDVAGGWAFLQVPYDDLVMARIVTKVSPFKRPVHGEKTYAQRPAYTNALDTVEKRFLENVVAVAFEHGAKHYPGMAAYENIDLSFVFGPPGTACQQWHMDSRDPLKPVVSATLIVAGAEDACPTEFADIKYVASNVEDDQIAAVALAMKLPMDWKTLVPAKVLDSHRGPHVLRIFHGDAIHRAPANPLGALERVCLFLSWGPPGATTERVTFEQHYNIMRVGTHIHIHTY